MRADRSVALAFLAALAALAPRTASAYCRTTTCDPNTEDCKLDATTKCYTAGIPLAWPGGCAGYSLQQDASAKVPLADATRILGLAFQAWPSVDCGGGAHPDLKLSDLGPVACAEVEYSQTEGNANIVVFRDQNWPYSTSSVNALALTTVTYAVKTGEIYDADMEVNGTANLTIGDTAVGDDLQSIVTHEAGHFVGMAHSGEKTATMFPVYTPHTTSLRHLSADNVAGICAAYPPGQTSASCDPTPHRGLSSACTDPNPPSAGSTSKCDVGGVGRRGKGGTALAVLLGGLACAAARRRRR